jgi:DNA-binding PadR family transcriptional regulator
MAADALEGGGIGLALDERDARAVSREEDRRAAPCEAGSDDDGVVLGLGHACPSAIVHLEPYSMKLNPSSYAVMALLKVAGESTPYELKQFLERSVENFWPVPHTTFYAEPTRLAQGGFLSERQEAGGRRRKLYALTDQGRAALDAWTHADTWSPPQLRNEGVLKIFAGADPLPILRRQAEWHRAKLAELEGYLGDVESGELRGPRGSLIAGITYHRVLLDALDEFLAEQVDLAGVQGGAPALGELDE